jgi:peptidyl-prolyl cis-trans isomerase D
VFFEVTDVIPARDRALDEVRDEAVAAWTEAETGERIAARAESLLERLKNGEPLSALAAEIGKSAGTAEGVKRGDTRPELARNAIDQAFAGLEGHVANAEGAGMSRILVKVDRVVVPAFFAETTDAEEIMRQLSAALKNDIVATFNQQIGSNRAISVNNAVYRQLTGQLSGQAPLQ